MNRAALTRAALAAGVLVLSSCYAYVPADPDAVPLGERVRVHLSRSAMADMLLAAEDTAAAPVEPVVAGTLSRREGDVVFVRVPIPVEREGFLVAPFGRDVRVPLAGILQLERRRLHGGRTALTAAGAAGLAAFVIYVIMDGAGGGAVPTPPGGENVRIPLSIGPGR